MARNICIQPCDFYGTGFGSFTFPVPGFPPGYGIKGAGQIDLKADCEGCSLAANFLLMIQPFLLSLGLPLCLLQCLLSIIKVAKKLVGSDGQKAVFNTDPTLKITLDPSLQIPFFNFEAIGRDYGVDDPSLMKRVIEVVRNCACLFDLTLPFKWICMLKALVMIIITLVNCAISLLRHLITLELRASVALGDSNVEIQKSAICLAGFVQVETQNLAAKIDVIAQLFKIIELIAKILENIGISLPGMSDVQNALQAIVNMLGNNPATGALLTALEDLKDALELLYCALNTASFGFCPMDLDCSACGGAATSGFQMTFDGAFPATFTDGDTFTAEVDGNPAGTVTINGQAATRIGAGATAVIPALSATTSAQPAGDTFLVDSTLGWSAGDSVTVLDGAYVLRTTIAGTPVPGTIQLSTPTSQGLSLGAAFIKPSTVYVDVTTPAGTNAYSVTFDIETTQAEYIDALNASLIGVEATAEGPEIRLTTTGKGAAFGGSVHGTGNAVPSGYDALTAIGFFGAADANLVNPGPNTVDDLDNVTSAELKLMFDATFAGSTATDNGSSVSWASNTTGNGSCVQLVDPSTGASVIGLDMNQHCGTQC